MSYTILKRYKESTGNSVADVTYELRSCDECEGKGCKECDWQGTWEEQL